MILIVTAAMLVTLQSETVASPDSVYLAAVENEPLIDQISPVVEEAYRRIGILAVSRKLPGERALAMLNSGELFGDVAHVEGLEKYYSNMIRVPVPLINFDAVVFSVRKNLSILVWSDLAPYNVCIRRGIKAIELATAGMKNIYMANGYEQIFAMLKVGRCDVAVLPRQAWLDVQRLNVKGLRSLEPPLQTWPMYHYIHKSHVYIIPMLTHELRTMQTNGLLRKNEDAFWNRVENVRRASTD
ncbi:MAG: hypothetical protein ACEQSK_16050 [Sphingomonadaceae bacterium]